MKLEENNPRRRFIKKSAGVAVSLSMLSGFFPNGFINLTGPDTAGKTASPHALKRIAVIVNTYRNSAHADVIITKLFVGIPTDDSMVAPQVQVVSMWMRPDRRERYRGADCSK